MECNYVETYNVIYNGDGVKKQNIFPELCREEQSAGKDKVND